MTESSTPASTAHENLSKMFAYVLQDFKVVACTHLVVAGLSLCGTELP